MRATAEAEYADFVTHHADRLCRTAYLMCGDWSRAEDVTQEALLKLYRSWPRLRDRGSIATYSRKVLLSVLIDGMRRRSSRELTGADALVADTPEPVDAVAGVEDRMLVVRALGALPPRQRACIVLRFFAQLSVDETAEALDCRPGTVKSQTARGLDALRHALASAGITDLVDLGG